MREQLSSGSRYTSRTVPQIATVLRPVYPYSVIPGGAYDATELDTKLASDHVAAQHYQTFSRTHMITVKSTSERRVYMSYRKGSAIYWTSKPVHLHAGETLLTDGLHYARARCGNRLSETPQQPVEKAPANAPSEQLLDLPESWDFPPPPNIPGNVVSPSFRVPRSASGKTVQAQGSLPGPAAGAAGAGMGTGPSYSPFVLEPGSRPGTESPSRPPLPSGSEPARQPLRHGVPHGPRSYVPASTGPGGSSPSLGGSNEPGSSSPGSGAGTEPGSSSTGNGGNTLPPISPPAGGGNSPFGFPPGTPEPGQSGTGPDIPPPAPIAVVPEPGSLLLLGTAIAAVVALRYRRR